MSGGKPIEEEPFRPKSGSDVLPVRPQVKAKQTVLSPEPVPTERKREEEPPAKNIPPQNFPQWYVKATKAINKLDPHTFKWAATKERSSPGTLYYSDIRGRSALPQPRTRPMGIKPLPMMSVTPDQSSDRVLDDHESQPKPKSAWKSMYGDPEPNAEDIQDHSPAPEHVIVQTEHTPHRMLGRESQLSSASQFSAHEMPLFTDDPRSSLTSTHSGRAGVIPHQQANLPPGVLLAVEEASHKPPKSVVLVRPRFSQDMSVARRMSRHVSISPIMDVRSARPSSLESDHLQNERPTSSRQKVTIADPGGEFSALHRGSDRGPLPNGRGRNTHLRQGTSEEAKAKVEIYPEPKSNAQNVTYKETVSHAVKPVGPGRDTAFLIGLKNNSFEDEAEEED